MHHVTFSGSPEASYDLARIGPDEEIRKRFTQAIAERRWSFLELAVASKDPSFFFPYQLDQAMDVAIQEGRAESFNLLIDKVAASSMGSMIQKANRYHRAAFARIIRAKFPTVSASVRGERLKMLAEERDFFAMNRLIASPGEEIQDKDAIEAFITAANNGDFSSVNLLLSTVLCGPDKLQILENRPTVLKAVHTFSQKFAIQMHPYLVGLCRLVQKANTNFTSNTVDVIQLKE